MLLLSLVVLICKATEVDFDGVWPFIQAVMSEGGTRVFSSAGNANGGV